MLYADKHIKSHEIHVNLKIEMAKVWDWLNTNKLTLNAKKSNFVIFRPYQRKWTVWLIFRFLITTPKPYLTKPHPGNFYINISKTNKKLTRSFTRFEAKLWNSIPAEIHQYPIKNNVHEFMLPLLQTAAVYLEAPVTLKQDKKKPSGSWTSL